MPVQLRPRPGRGIRLGLFLGLAAPEFDSIFIGLSPFGLSGLLFAKTVEVGDLGHDHRIRLWRRPEKGADHGLLVMIYYYINIIPTL